MLRLWCRDGITELPNVIYPEPPPSYNSEAMTKGVTVIETSLARKLRELEERLAHELMRGEERQELRDCILKLRKRFAVTVARR